MRRNSPTQFWATILIGIFMTGLAAAQSFDTKSEFGYKMDMIRDVDSALQSRWNSLGTIEKLFFYTKRAVPLWSWLVLCNTVQGADSQFFLGECLHSDSRHLLRLPQTEFRSEYLEVLGELWSSNPLDALTFSSATVGYSSNDVAIANIAPILHLGLFAWASMVGARYIRKNVSIPWLQSVPLRRAFWISVTLWIVSSVALRIASAFAPYNRGLLNLQTVVLVLFGIPAVLLGLALLVRFLVRKASWFSNRLRQRRPSPDFPAKRWHALVKYDEEVAATAALLQQYGDEWVDKLGEEFFALNEDRRYLRPIATRLLEEAQRSQ